MAAAVAAVHSANLNVAVRVQHHPSRAALIGPLEEALSGFADVQIVTDDVTGHRPDTWRAHRACLEAMPEGASHLLVVQDDARPCDNFAARTVELLEEAPGRIVCLFAPGFAFLTRRLQQAAQKGATLMELPQVAFVPCVAIVYPAATVAGLLEFVDGRSWPKANRVGMADDGVIADYCRARRVRPLVAVPSLVDHRDDVPSIAKPSHHRGGHRRAALFAD